MARTFARKIIGTLLVVVGPGCAPAVQPSPDVNGAFADDRMAYVGTAGGGAPVRGAASVDDGACVEIAPTACLPRVRAGRYCTEDGGPVDVILRDGLVADMVCFPPGPDGPLHVAAVDGEVPTIPDDLDHRAVVFADTDAVVEGDVVIEGDHVAIYGAGPDRTRIRGDVHLRGRFARLRGVRVEGDVFVEDAQAAITFSRVHGDLIVGGGETERSVIAGNELLGKVIVRAAGATIVANRVQGPFLIFGEDARCADNLAFDDLDGDATMDEQGEVLGRLGCEPNGLRYRDR